MVRLDGGVAEELGRTVVVLTHSYLLIERRRVPYLLSKSRSAAFGVLPAVDGQAAGSPEVRQVLGDLLESPDHVVALVDGVGVKYRVTPVSDLLPIHVKLYLEDGVPEDVGPLAVEFKGACDEAERLERELAAIRDERALLLDRVHADPQAGPRLSELSDRERLLRRKLYEARSRRKAARAALLGSLSRLGLGHLLGRLPDGRVSVHIPLLNTSLQAGVAGSAEAPARYVYGNVLRLLGYRERAGLYWEYAVAQLVKSINAARLNGRSEALVWVKPFLRVRNGERFEVVFSLSGRGRGVSVVDSPFMPDLETLSQLIPSSIRHAFGDTLEVRGVDVENALAGASPIGESVVRIPAASRQSTGRSGTPSPRR